MWQGGKRAHTEGHEHERGHSPQATAFLQRFSSGDVSEEMEILCFLLALLSC